MKANAQTGSTETCNPDTRAFLYCNAHLDHDGSRVLLSSPSDLISALIPAVSARLTRLPRLTDREREVVACIVAGYSNKEIAGALDIATKTVDTHAVRAMRKTGVRNRVQLAIWWVTEQWLAAHEETINWTAESGNRRKQ